MWVVLALTLGVVGLTLWQVMADKKQLTATDVQLRTDVQYLSRIVTEITQPGYQPAPVPGTKAPITSIDYPEVARSVAPLVSNIIEQNIRIDALAEKLTIPALYLKTVEEAYTAERYISISSKPGDLFTSSGGPAVPAADDERYFMDGMQITIHATEAENLNFPQMTKTKYANVWEDQASCEAGCAGTIYVVKAKNNAYFSIIVGSNNFDATKLQTLVDSILATMAAQ